ncbi:pantoate--beta-alanine ligase [Rathayibacter rathayi]|uniref:pantoate--beta-alanine ligase n=1 Tax=Rathayibacter rathayi TaxID=33887 RepID=UPI000CE87706|nr:pantoate--beta-alanine ligase [Rathayibacter rathayi]PPG75868.1 pantoate--beta-alanine ligase [Rathayibacter rathayi]PPI76154.1 pantoate--beta-alanine ligase [Rathayibacter rathayi]
MISTVQRIGDLRERLGEARRAGRLIALVPTMGALHAGHLALVERARELADVVVVSVFVNPLQFGPTEDLDRYPRDLAGDTALLDAAGVDLVFAPGVAEMYPDGPSSTRVVAGEIGGLYEGRARPGHFDGMLTVVAKLLNIAQPDVAVFGQKDAQQLFLVRRMVRDLDLPLAIEGVAIVREEDGLARSSRNRYLSEEQRRAGLALPRLLAAAVGAADRGVAAAIAAARAVAREEPLVKLEYLVVVNPATLLPVDADHHGPALMLVAAIVGTTRLLDNAPILLA